MQGSNGHHRLQQRRALRHPQHVVRMRRDLRAARGGDRDDLATASAHLRHADQHLLVQRVARRERDDRRLLIYERDGAVLYLRRRHALRVNVAGLLHLVRSLARNRLHQPAPEEEEAARVHVTPRDLLHVLFGHLDGGSQQGGQARDLLDAARGALFAQRATLLSERARGEVHHNHRVHHRLR